MSAPILPTGHDEYEALAVAWAIDALEPADQERFESHLFSCDACEQTVADMMQVAVELAYGVPDSEPPPALRRRMLAAAALHPPAPPLTAPTNGWVQQNGRRPGNRTDRPGSPRSAPDRWDDGRWFGAAAGDPGPGVPAEEARSGGGTPASPAPVVGSTEQGERTSRAGPEDTTGRSGPETTGRAGPGDGAPAAEGSARSRAGRPDPDEWAGLPVVAGTGTASRPASGRRDTQAGTGPARGRGAVRAVARHRRPDRRRLVSVLAAAALAAVSAITTWQVTDSGSDRPAVTVAADRVAALSARQGDRTVATVVVRGERTDVVTDVLTPNGSRNSEYVVWGMSADRAGVPQVVGTFVVTAEGLHSYPVRVVQPAGDYSVLAVSEEPAGSTPTVPSGVIARGALSR